MLKNSAPKTPISIWKNVPSEAEFGVKRQSAGLRWLNEGGVSFWVGKNNLEKSLGHQAMDKGKISYDHFLCLWLQK